MPSFKYIRTEAVSVLKEISAELIKRADLEGMSERRKCFVGLEEVRAWLLIVLFFVNGFFFSWILISFLGYPRK